MKLAVICLFCLALCVSVSAEENWSLYSCNQCTKGNNDIRLNFSSKALPKFSVFTCDVDIWNSTGSDILDISPVVDAVGNPSSEEVFATINGLPSLYTGPAPFIKAAVSFQVGPSDKRIFENFGLQIRLVNAPSRYNELTVKIRNIKVYNQKGKVIEYGNDFIEHFYTNRNYFVYQPNTLASFRLVNPDFRVRFDSGNLNEDHNSKITVLVGREIREAIDKVSLTIKLPLSERDLSDMIIQAMGKNRIVNKTIIGSAKHTEIKLEVERGADYSDFQELVCLHFNDASDQILQGTLSVENILLNNGDEATVYQREKFPFESGTYAAFSTSFKQIHRSELAGSRKK